MDDVREECKHRSLFFPVEPGLCSCSDQLCVLCGGWVSVMWCGYRTLEVAAGGWISWAGILNKIICA